MTNCELRRAGNFLLDIIKSFSYAKTIVYWVAVKFDAESKIERSSYKPSKTLQANQNFSGSTEQVDKGGPN